MVAADGGVFSFCEPFLGSMGGQHLNAPIVGMAATGGPGGYWEVGSDGGIFSFGDATFHGSTGSLHLNKPVVGMAATPDGGGYWLVASDGGIFDYGDAGFYGSAGSLALNKPIVGMAATPDGRGYWLVASDGGIFDYGDAGFYGSTGSIRLNKPVVGMAAAPDGHGYWLVASDGGIFDYGDAGFEGSAGSINLNKPVVGMAADARRRAATGSSPPTAASSPTATPSSTVRPAGSRWPRRSSPWDDRSVRQRPPVHVRLADLEAQARVEAVRRLPVRARRQVHGARAELGRAVQRGLHQGAGDTAAAGRVVDDDVLDPGPHAGRDLEDGEGQHAHDAALVTRHEQRGGGVGDDALQPPAVRRR